MLCRLWESNLGETVVGSILEHLGALVAQGTFHAVSLNRRAGKEPRSWFWLCHLTRFSEVNPATTSHVLHCSHSMEWSGMELGWCPCPLNPVAVIPSSGREKEQVWELGPIFQLLEWVSVTLMVTKAGGSMVPWCSHCCHQGW